MNISEIRRLQFDLTSCCNLKCPFCSRTKHLEKGNLRQRNLPFDLIRERFGCVFPYIQHVNFCGTFGEPTVHPDIIDIVSYFRDGSAAKISIDTNGATHDPKWWRRLQFDNFVVRFAIDGATDRSFSKYRIGAKFEDVIGNMKAFVEGGGTAEWEYVVFRHNEDEIPLAKEMAKDIGCEITFKRSRHYSDDFEMPINFDELPKRCDRCKFVDKKELYVSHDGIVEFCCRFQPRWMDGVPNGHLNAIYFEDLDGLDLNKHSIQEILKHEYFKFMSENYKTVCGKYRL